MFYDYTKIIHDKDDVSLEEYAWVCAKSVPCLDRFAYGDREITSIEVNHSHDAEQIKEYTERIQKYNQYIQELNLKSDEELVDENKKSYEEMIAQNSEEIDKSLKLKDKLDKMANKIKAWNAPSEYSNFKKFMLSKIEDDIKRLCGTAGLYEWADHLREKANRDAKTLRKERLTSLHGEIKDCTKELNEHVKRYEKFSKVVEKDQQWVNGLHRLLPNPYLEEDE